VPTRPAAAPPAAFKSQRDFVSRPKVGAPAPTLGHHPPTLINPNGVAAMRYAFAWPRLHHLTPPKTPPNSRPTWRLPPAPAVRHHCRTPNPIESFSPVGPASSGNAQTAIAPRRGSHSLLNPLAPATIAAPRAAFKSQRDFGSQPNGCEARATLGFPGATDSTPTGLWLMPPWPRPVPQLQRRASMPAQANGLGMASDTTQDLKRANQTLPPSDAGLCVHLLIGKCPPYRIATGDKQIALAPSK